MLQLYPNYYDVIKEPIDLKMIAKKIQDNEYRSLDDMDRDVSLMVQNAKTFNEPKSLIYKVSKVLFHSLHRILNFQSAEKLKISVIN